jgi:hypothetical protein
MSIVTTLAGMDWQVAEPHARVYKPTMAINIQQGKITLSRGAVNLAGKPEHVRLAYSAKPPSIAVIPTSPEDALGYTIGARRNGAQSGKPTGVHHQTLSTPFCRMLATAGYSGTIIVPMQWHPDGILWGDLTMATRRTPNKTKGDSQS